MGVKVRKSDKKRTAPWHEDLKEGEACPLVRGACIRTKCTMWQHILGKHPQTAVPIDHWDCSIKWAPVLLVSVAQEVRQTAAAVESSRNEQVRNAAVLANALITRANSVELLQAPREPRDVTPRPPSLEEKH